MNFEEDEISGYYNDDGEKLNPNLISKPDLCTTCRKDEEGEEEEVLCNLNRLDQAGEKEFICYAYESKFEEKKNSDEEKDEGISF
ncbi:MAG: hypothetical protein HON76_06745 [Candidatus Scalindua sp.]|jgi:hypothetical protein|nr:hypothetical protein [Candidatus Scalindua sp.]MBT5303940.1 hypothetical protein [Candidatus Scalindua sp.]MBT6231114.1 hypothetical protein [Candidatus Scalindua sp.]MBT6562206.1 hypothetical protein [Candidatus Scalindua sp.]MBT7212787.1 hypothetical protein [Candidatus Scalindua sp.]